MAFKKIHFFKIFAHCGLISEALNSGYKTPACGDFCYRILIRTNWKILIFIPISFYYSFLLSFFSSKKVLNSHFLLNFFFQSKLAHIGESRMEMDYKLVENEGLFQEYLEMGKKFLIRRKSSANSSSYFLLS